MSSAPEQKPGYDFWGNYSGKIDKKGRVQIPADFFTDFASADQEAVWVRKGIGDVKGYLEVWPSSANERLKEETKNIEDIEKRKQVLRGYASLGRPCKLDNQGRLVIPQDYRALFGHDEEVIWLGIEQVIELWPRSHFEASENALADSANTVKQEEQKKFTV